MHVGNRSFGTACNLWILSMVAVLTAGRGHAATTLVSVGLGGQPANAASSDPWVSADGRYVVFESAASNLVAGDTNATSDVFVRDLQTSTTERVSVGPGGVEGNGPSFSPMMSADGRIVVFLSYASNFVAGAPNGFVGWGTFAYDRSTGTITYLNINANAANPLPVRLSADGRFVAFFSGFAVVPGDTNNHIDTFVLDRNTGAIDRVSVASDGTQGDADTGYFMGGISADGRFVTFYSYATNMVANDTNGRIDEFVHDRQTHQTTRVSIASDGTQGNADSFFSSISADGRLVAFQSAASNLVPGDTNGAEDYFVRDLQAGTTTRIPVRPGGGGADSYLEEPFLSADGRKIAFYSPATNLVAHDTNGQSDIFLLDVATATTTRVSVSTTGNDPNGKSWYPALSSDGRVIVFMSQASNLVPNDGNGTVQDIFATRVTCGDGTVDAGEDCDDGNTTDCDGCSATCRTETGCGDRVVCGGEACDDGNTTAGDGCSSTCTLETLDVSGSWQITTDFEGGTIGTEFFTLAANGGGSFSGSEDECGSFALSGTIHDVVACSTSPATVSGQTVGAEFSFPATGDYGFDKTVATPFAYFTCPAAARVVGSSRLHGRIETDGAGRAVRITGTMLLTDVALKDSFGTTCLGVPGVAASGTFEMRRDEVPVGGGVTVQPRSASTITFDTVDTAGRAGITALTAPNGEIPANFQLLGAAIYYDVSTTATVSGAITTCLPYPDVDQDGIVDGTSPPVSEDDLQVLHKESGVYVDRTVSRDPVANVVCGASTSLSPFLFGAPGAPAATTTTTSTLTTTSRTATTSITTTTIPAGGSQRISGKRLTLKDNVDITRRAVTAQSKDLAISLGGGDGSADDPVASGGGSFRVRTSDGCNGPCDTTYPLTAAGGWTYVRHQGDNEGYKYKGIGGLVRSVTVKPGAMVKVTGKGALGHALAASPAPVDVVLRIGARQYCMRFGGTASRFVPGRTFTAQDAPAPDACPP